jgi:UDP-N-acetylglucosamine 2-epimerase (non-hydrolysing)
MTVIGTRPEAIKLAPVILAARACPAEFDVRVVRTGQHRELVDELLAEFGIDAHVDLNIMQPIRSPPTCFRQACAALGRDCRRAARLGPRPGRHDNDTRGCARRLLRKDAGRTREAGLRTGDRRCPFPEETNRTLTTHVADLHFAPTARAQLNLLREGIDPARIVLTRQHGRRRAAARARPQRTRRPACSLRAVLPRYRASSREPRRRADADLRRGARDPAPPSVRAGVDSDAPAPRGPARLERTLGGHERALLGEPLGYTAFVRALEGASLVLTDSGGIQEECAALGKPVLVMREHTERPRRSTQASLAWSGPASKRSSKQLHRSSTIPVAAKQWRDRPTFSAMVARRSASWRRCRAPRGHAEARTAARGSRIAMTGSLYEHVASRLVGTALQRPAEWLRRAKDAGFSPPPS